MGQRVHTPAPFQAETLPSCRTPSLRPPAVAGVARSKHRQLCALGRLKPAVAADRRLLAWHLLRRMLVCHTVTTSRMTRQRVAPARSHDGGDPTRARSRLSTMQVQPHLLCLCIRRRLSCQRMRFLQARDRSHRSELIGVATLPYPLYPRPSLLPPHRGTV